MIKSPCAQISRKILRGPGAHAETFSIAKIILLSSEIIFNGFEISPPVIRGDGFDHHVGLAIHFYSTGEALGTSADFRHANYFRKRIITIRCQS